MRALVAGLAVLAALLALGPAAGRAAAVPREFYGVVTTQNPSTAEFETMGRGKVGTFRAVLSWASVETTQGQFNWAQYDQMVANAAANGIRVLPMLYGSPRFAARTETTPPTSPAARGAWTQFVRAAVSRYKAGGTFWTSDDWNAFVIAHPGAQPIPIVDWQVWNETNSPSFWLPKPTAKQYASFLKLTSAAIHASDPAARVMLAGLFTRPSQRRAVPLEEYLNDLYEVPKIKNFFDAVAIHPYARKTGDPLKTVRRVRGLMRKHRDRATPIWITELGWASSGIPSRYTTSATGQAQRLEQSFSSLAAAQSRFGIAGILWFAFRDTPFGSFWLYRTGLFDDSGVPKPAWFSFVRFTGGSP